MNQDDQKPDMAERYTMATTSSHLRLEEGRCNVDILIAAGWLKESLGTKLHRVRGEFDRVQGEMRAQGPHGDEWRAIVLLAEQAIRQAGSPIPNEVRSEPERIRREMQRAALAERAMVLVRLGTLEPMRIELHRLAVTLATRNMFMRDDNAVRVLTGRVIDVWLAPLCETCEGRGFNGGQHRGEPKVTCRSCRSTGLRRESVGHDSEERRFTHLLLGEIEMQMTQVDQQMRAALAAHSVTPPPPTCPASQDALKQRLVDLRSPMADVD